MTNPNNAIGTNGAYGGRTSVNAFNDDLAIWSGRGVMSGWACSPNSGMTVQIGGVSGTRDVAIAQDNAGNRTTINNISGSPVQITIDTAPSTNSRIDSIVAYVDNPATGISTDVDNPGTCGIIDVKGTVASSPSAPNDSAIRTAITGDGASGSTAYYVVLANITVGTNVTVIQSSAISGGGYATIQTDNIGNAQVTASKLASNSVTTAKINNGAVTSSKIDFTTLPFPYLDYANRTSITTSGQSFTYTPTKDGIAVVRSDIHNTGSAGEVTLKCDVSRGGVTYTDVKRTGIYFDTIGYNHFYAEISVLLKAGDTATFIRSASGGQWQSSYFYPFAY